VGGAGYIGGAVTELLVAERIPFAVYDSLVYEPHYLKRVDFVCGDVRDTPKLEAVLANYTHVIWLAAIVGDGACDVNPELTVEINQEAVQWLAKNYHGRIVFTSTCSVYGQFDTEVDEESGVQPLSLYAKTKLAAEGFLQEENSLIFRLGTAFGIASGVVVDTHVQRISRRLDSRLARRTFAVFAPGTASAATCARDARANALELHPTPARRTAEQRGRKRRANAGSRCDGPENVLVTPTNPPPPPITAPPSPRSSRIERSGA